MLLDNENENLKVHEWISKYTEEGTLDIVTGYFTVGALAYLSEQLNEKIMEFKFILGDIVNSEIDTTRALDLLNENITICGKRPCGSCARPRFRATTRQRKRKHNQAPPCQMDAPGQRNLQPHHTLCSPQP